MSRKGKFEKNVFALRKWQLGKNACNSNLFKIDKFCHFFLCFLPRRATYWYGFIMLLIGFIMATVLPDVKVVEKNNNNIALENRKEHPY